MQSDTLLALLLIGAAMPTTVTADRLKSLKKVNPFSFDLGVKVIPSKDKQAGVTICSHGYGHCNEIVDSVRAANAIKTHLIGFNFPDFGITDASDHAKSTFGSIDEILPLLYLIKRCVADLGLDTVNLYGFSAGGGAVINAIAALNETTFDKQLAALGITESNKKAMLDAVQKGTIILDCPLKSIDEIIALRGPSKNFSILDARYRKNGMRPIDAISKLAGLSLNILLYFEKKDDVLGNRDDKLFIERLKAANKGATTVVMESDGGHNGHHKALWEQYKHLDK